MIFKDFNIKGKNFLISGAGGNIGRNLSLRLAQLGVNIAAFDIDAISLKKVEEIFDNKGYGYIPITVDLTKQEEIRKALEKLMKKWKSIDVLINCIGHFGSGKQAQDINESDWDRDFDINLKSVFFCCREVGRKMIEQGYGKIINFSSQASYNYITGTPKSTYSVGKAAINMLTRSLAYEWSRYNVYVNAVAPGFIYTKEDIEKSGPAEKKFSKLEIKRMNSVPLKRLGTVDDLLGPIILLSSDSSNFITGEIIMIDGGYTLAL
jgi:NAD(P)-dependent dehydrogenase (short-subunit alcohol dehydrogenase family)